MRAALQEASSQIETLNLELQNIGASKEIGRQESITVCSKIINPEFAGSI